MLMKYALGNIHLVITQRGGGGLGYLMDLFDVKGRRGGQKLAEFLHNYQMDAHGQGTNCEYYNRNRNFTFGRGSR